MGEGAPSRWTSRKFLLAASVVATGGYMMLGGEPNTVSEYVGGFLQAMGVLGFNIPEGIKDARVFRASQSETSDS